MNIRHLQLPLALALALGATGAHALGLGPIEVKSGLNQPLVAEIPILSAAPGELEELEVRLASPEAFARVGLERPVGLTANLQMEVVRNAAGQPVIRVTTPSRFNEPVLTFLLEANWGRGKVVREFNALVDPPYIAPAVVRPMQAPTVAVAPPPPPEPEPYIAPPQAEPVPETPPDRLTVTDLPPDEPVAEPEPLPPEPVYVPTPEPAVSMPEPVASEPPAPEPMPLPEPEPLPVEPEPEPIAAEPVPEPEPPAPEPVPAPEPEPVPEPEPIAAEPPPPAPEPTPIPEPTPVPEPAPVPDAATLGPVQEGQTLWSIAEAARLERAVTVNQMMLALQRANPGAFIDDNINLLKEGSVLRLPARDEIVTLGEAEAALLVREQATAWSSRRAPVPQPAETVADAPAPAPVAAAPAPAPAAAPSPDRGAEARLEIVPPSGDELAARDARSGASQTGGGSELRAELSQTREDLAAREAELAELTSQIDDLEAQQSDSERLIELQDSRMKALQERLAREQASAGDAPVAAAAPTGAAEAPTEAAAAAAAANAATPAVAAPGGWYTNPYVLGGGALLLLGGLVMALRGRRSSEPVPTIGRRISDDEALQASLSPDRPDPAVDDAVATMPVADVDDPVAARLRDAVAARPDDLEAHISLLRHHYARHETDAFQAAAEDMRGHVRSTLDPRWREAVVMGVALSPGNPLFSQAGWNAPKFGDSGVIAATPASPTAGTVSPVAAESALAPAPSFVRDAPAAPVVVEPEAGPEVTPVDVVSAQEAELAAELGALQTGENGVPDFVLDVDGVASDDVVVADIDEDDGSATKIELARAYLDIGDVDGARGMLEEVLADGSPSGKAEAAQLLREIG